MSNNRRLFLVVAVLVLASLACQAGATADNTSVPEAVTVEETTPKIETLFEDDFSSTGSGWDDIEDEEGITGYRDGGYRILINKTDWYFWSTPGVNFSDVVISVEATKSGGPDNNEFGVICRYVDEDNFYIFSISSDGYYGISKFVAGEQSGVGMEDMQFNDQIIKLGASTNNLRATCNGSNLKFEVNGQTLVDVSDSSLTTGDVGVIASTLEEMGVNILFDNFVVTKP
jgi:hypothetical protein